MAELKMRGFRREGIITITAFYTAGAAITFGGARGISCIVAAMLIASLIAVAVPVIVVKVVVVSIKTGTMATCAVSGFCSLRRARVGGAVVVRTAVGMWRRR